MSFRVSEDWFPVSLDFFSEMETLRLRRLVGPEADVYPVRLWAWAFAKSPDGKVDPECVEDIVGWRGDPGKLIAALMDERVGFVAKDGKIRGWQKWAGRFRERALKAKSQTRDRQADFKKRTRDETGNASGNASSNASGNASNDAESSPESDKSSVTKRCNKENKKDKEKESVGSSRASALDPAAPPPPSDSRTPSPPDPIPPAASMLASALRRVVRGLRSEPDGEECAIWGRLLDRAKADEILDVISRLAKDPKAERYRAGGEYPIEGAAKFERLYPELVAKLVPLKGDGPDEATVKARQVQKVRDELFARAHAAIAKLPKLKPIWLKIAEQFVRQRLAVDEARVFVEAIEAGSAVPLEKAEAELLEEAKQKRAPPPPPPEGPQVETN